MIPIEFSNGAKMNNSVWPPPSAEITAPIQRTSVIGRPFKKGQSGNPSGRPKGSRNRLTDSVLKRIADDFAKHGADVLERVRIEEPATYLKFIISLLPRELIMQFEQHRPAEVGKLNQNEIVELIECGQTQKLAEQVYRNKPPKVTRR